MEEIIKPNDYVRTHKGKIYKVTNVYILKITCGHTSLRYNDIKSHSQNIIDLIEVGDYVNGVQVVENKNGMLFAGLCGECYFYNEMISNPKSIKDIVTHEQFESIKYRLE